MFNLCRLYGSGRPYVVGWRLHINAVSRCKYSGTVDSGRGGGVAQSVLAYAYGLEDRAIEVRSPAETISFFSKLCVQTGSEVHPASYPMGTRDSSIGLANFLHTMYFRDNANQILTKQNVPTASVLTQ
jgi:hypothetical protein